MHAPATGLRITRYLLHLPPPALTLRAGLPLHYSCCARRACLVYRYVPAFHHRTATILGWFCLPHNARYYHHLFLTPHLARTLSAHASAAYARSVLLRDVLAFLYRFYSCYLRTAAHACTCTPTCVPFVWICILHCLRLWFTSLHTHIPTPHTPSSRTRSFTPVRLVACLPGLPRSPLGSWGLVTFVRLHTFILPLSRSRVVPFICSCRLTRCLFYCHDLIDLRSGRYAIG